MTLRVLAIFGVSGLAMAVAGCSTQPTPPPRVVATLPSLKPPPPVMPPGGYAELDTAPQRPDGTYVTPNFDMSDAAAVWHLRGALNVAALGCDQAGGGIVDGYNAWLRGHRQVLDAAQTGYLHDWEQTGWWDWRNAYENQQTRLYNFYSQSPIRAAFCAAARVEIAKVGTIADADLPQFARAALVRLDQPFIDFFTGVDAWRDYYAPKVSAPRFVRTIPDEPAAPPVGTSDASAPVAPVTSPVTPTVVDNAKSDTTPPGPDPSK